MKQIDIIESDIKTGMEPSARRNPSVYKGLNYRDAAEYLHCIGYRKQSEGEWETIQETPLDKVIECTACKKQFYFAKRGQLNIDRVSYCPNCGAKMKGGAE